MLLAKTLTWLGLRWGIEAQGDNGQPGCRYGEPLVRAPAPDRVELANIQMESRVALLGTYWSTSPI